MKDDAAVEVVREAMKREEPMLHELFPDHEIDALVRAAIAAIAPTIKEAFEHGAVFGRSSQVGVMRQAEIYTADRLARMGITNDRAAIAAAGETTT